MTIFHISLTINYQSTTYPVPAISIHLSMYSKVKTSLYKISFAKNLTVDVYFHLILSLIHVTHTNSWKITTFIKDTIYKQTGRFFLHLPFERIQFEKRYIQNCGAIARKDIQFKTSSLLIICIHM